LQAVIATLCDDVSIRENGLMDITGAGQEWIGVDRLPIRTTIKFALLLQFEMTDDRTDLGLSVGVVSAADGKSVGGMEGGVMTLQRTYEVVEGAPPYIPMAFEMEVELANEGQHAVVVKGRANERLAFVVFVVKLVA
jgi:hypothetical protein